MQLRWLCWLAIAPACAPPAPRPAPSAPPTPTAPSTASAAVPLGGPATVGLMTDFALAPPMVRAARGGRHPFKLADGAVGYLDPSGVRAIATLRQLRRLTTPDDLEDLCVAHDGRATFAVSAKGDRSRLLRADGFDQPMTDFGDFETELQDPGGERSLVASDDQRGTRIASCASGEVRRVGPPTRLVESLLWATGVQVLRLHAKDASYACLVRTDATPRWASITDCDVTPRIDGSVALVGRTSRRCLSVADEKGVHPCQVPLGPEVRATAYPAPRVVLQPLVATARFIGPRQMVIVADGRIVKLDADGRWGAPITPPSLRACAPVVPEAPLFRCVDDVAGGVKAAAREVLGRVTADGAFHEELRRPLDPYAARVPIPGGSPGRVHTTADGGVALAGNCAGDVGNVACVRGPDGTWHDRAFSAALIERLERAAPVTRVLPTLDGRLVVGTASGGFEHPDVRVFPPAGPAVELTLPRWVWSSLSGLTAFTAAFATTSEVSRPDFSWSDPAHARAWPIVRPHPAFQTPEACRVEIGLDGSFDAACVEGRVVAVGRRGLWERRASELAETLDGGATWSPVALPEGASTHDVVCVAIGCRVGPYFRLGWGRRASP